MMDAVKRLGTKAGLCRLWQVAIGHQGTGASGRQVPETNLMETRLTLAELI